MRREPETTGSFIAVTAELYFSFMGELFPTMCSCDEFIFMPRVPGRYGLETLTGEMISDAIKRAKTLLPSLNDFQTTVTDPGELADAAHLARSIKSFLLEFEEVRSWQIDPTLYLRLINLSLERVFTNHTLVGNKILEHLAIILESIPVLLSSAADNLHGVPETYRLAAMEMGPSTTAMLNEIITGFLSKNHLNPTRLKPLQTRALETLETFMKDISGRPYVSSHFSVGKDLLNEMLRASFGCEVPADEIRVWALEQVRFLEDELSQLAGQVRSGFSWREIYDSCDSTGCDRPLGVLYRDAVEKLASFFSSAETDTPGSSRNLIIRETPPYLKPIRSDAAYRAPDPTLPLSSGVFYIPATNSESTRTRAGKEHLFLAAHETFPGHHLLDYHRLRQNNSVRRWIEAPLFYEGWACYAESLVTDWGLSRRTEDRIILLKRRLWRVNRLLLEHDIHGGNISLKEATGKLSSMGYDNDQARLLARRYTFNPGYQTTYSWGLHSIHELKRKETGLETGLFERILLGEGQVPFTCFPSLIDGYRKQTGGVLTNTREKSNHSWKDLSVIG